MDCGGVSGKWGLLRACLGVVDGLTGLWTARQAETVAVALLGRGQEEIAKQLGKRQPTIYRALQTAGWRGIEGLVNEVENSP